MIRRVGSPQQHDTSGIVAGFGLAQRDVPAHDDAVAGSFANVIIGRQPFAFDRKPSLRSSALADEAKKGRGDPTCG
jgi:hypothetical protein